MPRFTPATEAALIAAGWFEDRTVPDEQMNDWLILNWFPHPLAPLGYSTISPQAWRVLKEFGGLSIERASRANKPTYPFVFNPLLVPDCGYYDSGLVSYGWDIGATLFPLGTIEYDCLSRDDKIRHRAIAISDDGRFFSPGYKCPFLGHSIEEALEKIVSGEIDEKPFDAGTVYDDEAEKGFEEKQIEELWKSIYKRIRGREQQLMQGQWPEQLAPLSQAKNSDFFAITDWDAEAARISRAFGVVGDCHFFGPYKQKRLYPKYDRPPSSFENIPLSDDLMLYVNYQTDARNFQLKDSAGNSLTSARLLWNGDAYAHNHHELSTAQRFAKGLFNLGLLTPKVEEKLKLDITHHEKLEWQLEFESFKDSD